VEGGSRESGEKLEEEERVGKRRKENLHPCNSWYVRNYDGGIHLKIMNKHFCSSAVLVNPPTVLFQYFCPPCGSFSYLNTKIRLY
jgi:hypothetical protein